MSDADKAKDALQVVAESAADHLGKIFSILTGAVRDVANELGDWFNEVATETRRPSEDAD
jgi:hypothetical protein